MRSTRIVCTIGPACSSAGMMMGLARAGMDVARLNFSHGTQEEHAAAIVRLRHVAERLSRPLAILQDLSGPKVRLGEMPAPITLHRGDEVIFSTTTPAESGAIPLPVPEMASSVGPGDRLLANDGEVELRVLSASPGRITARVTAGGVISSHKGITAPGVSLPIPAVTAKDVDDLRFGLAHDVDWVAASYIRGSKDILPLRAVMEEAGLRRPIIAKIEKREAVHNIEAIVEAVDGVMVARGDLGVEIPIDEVPMVQKRIIRLCNRAGKPVITATQMLESMIENARPTRAEATDVANAILDGSDAVMLSGETAAGAYPLQAVRMMARIAERTDGSIPDPALFGERRSGPPDVPDAVARAAVGVARAVRARAILCATASGSTARLIARCRPDAPIIAATPSVQTYRRLALTWGVRPLLIEEYSDTDQMMESALLALMGRHAARAGDRIVLTAGLPVGVPGNTNLIRVHVVGQPIRPS